ATNRGRYAIKDWFKGLKQQADTTIDNDFNSGWGKTSPSGTDPNSVPSLISSTPTVGTIGGLARSSFKSLQNGVETAAIADIGSEAGIGSMLELAATYSVGQSMTDLVVMSQTKWGNLGAYLSTQQRFRADEKLKLVNVRSIDIIGMTIVFENTNVMNAENSIADDSVYGINSKHFFIQVISGFDGRWGTQLERVNKSLNKYIPYEWFGQLMTDNPRGQWVASNVTT
ncbi:hypothetical protein LCGC14_3035010, partial [marine sediment metagenome]